ncbi:FAD-dependent oxidoreductase [Paenibacillus caseinilyticus]|uniref:Amine oxidase n=1 Tax=Paenibacillus mucilaginosus K02 TaxID=997761 RepID=I0BE27_9BACL|nr:NAD(P)/FAD-dependent oxidoreductase [Paenibacillus mucilaginosus]AFH60624.1 amine oxidase [Paenibacillus mucilaginosus K02]
MARSPLAWLLKEAYLVAGAVLGRRQFGHEPILQESHGIRIRVKTSARLVESSLSNPILKKEMNIAIIGGGLAGLTCAYRLKQAGLKAKVYEATERVGGRCWTRRGEFAEGQIVERGGELINTEHTAIRELAEELGLKIDDLEPAKKKDTKPLYYFDGTPYTFSEATNDFMKIFDKLQKDITGAGFPTLFNKFTKRGFELDHMSIIDWINETVPGGIDSKFGQLLDLAYNIEYGAESSEQSSLNLIYLLGFAERGLLQIFGSSDGRFQIRGGSDLITTRLNELLSDQIVLGTELIAIKKSDSGRFILTIKHGNDTKEVKADKVVLTIPFAVLRSSVDISKAGFSKLKKIAIKELGMGTNTKMHVQFTDRHWSKLGCNGETFADTGYQSTYEVNRVQPGKLGILANYTGGEIGAGFNVGNPTTRAKLFLEQIEPLLPGISSKWNGKATVDYWPAFQWTRGSYSFWKVGQYTKFAGIEGMREGNCHFAGEHTSIEYQGYLNGAVESGERVADEIIQDLKENKE